MKRRFFGVFGAMEPEERGVIFITNTKYVWAEKAIIIIYKNSKNQANLIGIAAHLFLYSFFLSQRLYEYYSIV